MYEWERKRSKCFFTYIYLDLFRSHPSKLYPLTKCFNTFISFYSGGVTNVDIKGTYSVVEFETLRLTCDASCNNGSCAYEWSGYEIPAAYKNSQVLTLTSVSRQYNDKSYECVVTDNVDEQKGEDTQKIDVFCKWYCLLLFFYSQTCVKGHLWIKTTL